MTGVSAPRGLGGRWVASAGRSLSHDRRGL